MREIYTIYVVSLYSTLIISNNHVVKQNKFSFTLKNVIYISHDQVNSKVIKHLHVCLAYICLVSLMIYNKLLILSCERCIKVCCTGLICFIICLLQKLTKLTVYFMFAADREVQRILLELLNQMDGFDQTVNVKVRIFLIFLGRIFYLQIHTCIKY